MNGGLSKEEVILFKMNIVTKIVNSEFDFKNDIIDRLEKEIKNNKLDIVITNKDFVVYAIGKK